MNNADEIASPWLIPVFILITLVILGEIACFYHYYFYSVTRLHDV